MGASFEVNLTREDAAMNMNARFVGGMKGLVAASVLAGVAVVSASAAEVVTYDTSKYEPPTYIAQNVEFGDDIQMAPDIGLVGLTQFKFSYFISSRFVPGAGKSMTFRLYALDGAASTPGTLLYSTAAIPLTAGTANNVDITIALGSEASPLWVPSNIGWTVEFSGLSPREIAGLWAADTTVGSSLNTYFVKTASGWSMEQIAGGTVPGTFSATVLAVPEPSVTQLGMMGLLMLFGGRFFRRK